MRRSESDALGSILGLTRRNEGYNRAENSRLVPGFLWTSELPSGIEDALAGIDRLKK
jgi:hypothetical protein